MKRFLLVYIKVLVGLFLFYGTLYLVYIAPPWLQVVFSILFISFGISIVIALP